MINRTPKNLLPDIVIGDHIIDFKTQADRTVPEDAALFDPAQPIGEIVDAADVLAEPLAEPTLDRYLDRSPKLGLPINYPEMVAILQRKRQFSITAEEKRKADKQEKAND